MNDSPVLTPKEAALYLGLDRLGCAHPEKTVRSYVNRGLLECVMIGGRMAFLRDQLDRLLQSRRRSAKAARRTARVDEAARSGRPRRRPGRPAGQPRLVGTEGEPVASIAG